MNFCSDCGNLVVLQIPKGDTLPRYVCQSCALIHYQNPRIIAGGIAEHQGKILLCRRAIEPRFGLWTLPAGFMELGESTATAAYRETKEEACAELQNTHLHALIDIPHINQVHIFFRGTLLHGAHAAGTESLETALFAEEEIPWDQLAFRSVHIALQTYFSDRKQRCFNVHTHSIPPL